MLVAPVYGPQAKYAYGLGIVPVNGSACLHHTGGMISFSSSIHVDPHTGVGAFASTNAAIGEYRPRDVGSFACELMRAIREGTSSPPPPAIKQAEQIPNASDYSDVYAAAGGEMILLRARGTQLLLSYKGQEVALQSQADESFLVPLPRFERLPLCFQRAAGRPVAAWWGETCFGTDRPQGRASEARLDAGLASLMGYYSNNDPWAGNYLVFARGRELWLNGTKPLVALADGSYRVGTDPNGCERVRFEAMLNGKAQRLIFSGVDHERDTTEIAGIFGRPL